jgi:hypothetical protein
MATGVPIERAQPRSMTLPNAGLALTGLTAVAGTIHLVATIEHIDQNWELVAFFAIVGIAQAVAAWWVYRKPEDMRMLRWLALGSLAIALLWVWSRTIGLSFGPETGRRKVGVGDTIATLFELWFAALVGLVLWRGERAVTWLSSGLGVRLTCAILSLGLMLAAVGGHQH